MQVRLVWTFDKRPPTCTKDVFRELHILGMYCDGAVLPSMCCWLDRRSIQVFIVVRTPHEGLAVIAACS